MEPQIASQIYIQFHFLQTLQNIVENLVSRGLATHVGGKELGLVQVGINGSVDLSSGAFLAEELQHQGNTAESSNGVGNTLALDIGSTAVARLTNSKAITDVSAGNETQGTDQSGSTVGQNVTVQVGGNNDVVVLGLTEELVDHGVDNLLLDQDGGELFGGQGLAGSLTEETVGLGQNVGLVGDGHHSLVAGRGSRGSRADLLAAQSNLTSNGGDARGGTLGNTLDGLGNLAVGALDGLLLLHVQILGVLTDNDEVDGVAVAAAKGGLDGTHVGEQVELLAQGNDRGGVAGNLGGGRAGSEFLLAGEPIGAVWATRWLRAYLTAPNRAPSHSFLRVSTVLSGKAVPVFWKVS